MGDKKEFFYDEHGDRQEIKYFTDSKGNRKKVPYKELEDIYGSSGYVYPGSDFYDDEGCFRRYGDSYYIRGLGGIYSPKAYWKGEPFYDGKGYERNPGDWFYDSKGTKRSPESTEYYDFRELVDERSL